MLKKTKTGRITCRNKRAIRRFAGDSPDNRTGSTEDSSNSSKPKDMEETWADMDKEPDSTNDNPRSTPTPEEIATSNASEMETMKQNVKMFRSMHGTKNSSEIKHGNVS